MEYRKIEDHYVVRMEKGEEVLGKLIELCRTENIKVGSIVGLGAASHVSVALYDMINKEYHKRDFDEPMEITSFVGNISTKEGEIYLHCHINVCDAQLNVHGGHLTNCVISATGEFIVNPLEGVVEREFSQEIGLNLLKFF